MPWEYILNIKINNKIVYKRDIDENKICISYKNKGLLDKNNCNGETPYNMELNDKGR